MKLSVSLTNYSWPATDIRNETAALARVLDQTAVDTLWVADSNWRAFFRHDMKTGEIVEKIQLTDKDPLIHGGQWGIITDGPPDPSCEPVEQVPVGLPG